MLSFLIYMLIQIILGFSFLAGLLASSWNVLFKSLKYTSKLIFMDSRSFDINDKQALRVVI